MQLVIETDGSIRCIYAENIDLQQLGQVAIQRASRVEPVAGGWTADLSLLQGPQLGPFSYRSSALSAELQWLEEHWL